MFGFYNMTQKSFFNFQSIKKGKPLIDKNQALFSVSISFYLGYIKRKL